MNEQDIVYRLRKRAEIRRQIQTRKSVQEGKPDRIADLLEAAAAEIETLRNKPARRSKYTLDELMSQCDLRGTVEYENDIVSPVTDLKGLVNKPNSPVTTEDMNIMSTQSLKREMLDVARGELKAPADAGQNSFESVEAARAWSERNADDLAAHGRNVARMGIAGTEFDPMNPDSVNSFLEFLVNDVEMHPERLHSIDAGLVDRIRKLVGNIKVDLDAPLQEPMPDVLTKFAKFSPNFMAEGRVDHEQAARKLQAGTTSSWEGMTCPVCGAARLIHGTRDATYSYKGQSTILPALTGNYCPACPAMFLDLDETRRAMDLTLEFNNKVDGK